MVQAAEIGDKRVKKEEGSADFAINNRKKYFFSKKIAKLEIVWEDADITNI